MNFYDAIILITIFSLIILFTFIAKSNVVVKPIKKGFGFMLLLIGCTSICEWIGVITDGNIKLKVLHMIAKFLELSITPFIPFVLGKSLQKRKNTHDLFYIIILLLHCLLQFSSLFFKTTFYIDSNGFYHHSNAYFIYYIMIILSIFYLMYYMIKQSIDYQGINILSLCLIITFTISGALFQILNHEIRVVWLIVAVSSILFFIYYVGIILRIDDLTGLLNRRTFDRYVEQKNQANGALFFDINKFKEVNDDYGHQYGDECLQKVAKSIKKIYGKYGYCYRIGGDEFCVILNKSTSNVEMLKLDFLNDLAKERLKDKNLPEVAIGYSSFDSSMTIKELIHLADKSMYNDKNNK